MLLDVLLRQRRALRLLDRLCFSSCLKLHHPILSISITSLKPHTSDRATPLYIPVRPLLVQHAVSALFAPNRIAPLQHNLGIAVAACVLYRARGVFVTGLTCEVEWIAGRPAASCAVAGSAGTTICGGLRGHRDRYDSVG